MTDSLSAAAEGLAVNAEVSSRAAYDRVYHRPEWPGGASGVTWGIGYDAGQTSAVVIAADWKDHVSPTMLGYMMHCAGVKGEAAHALLPSVKPFIDIPWDAAIAVFEKRDVPKYLAVCRKHLPNFDALPSDCQGALLSLTYNRDAGLYELSTDRAREMHAIKQHMAARAFDRIPDELRSMKRLWPTMAGLRKRRDDEATLFEHGWATRGIPPAPTPRPAAPAQPVAPNEDVWSHLLHAGISYLEKIK